MTGQVWVRRGVGGTAWGGDLLTTTTNHPFGDGVLDAFPMSRGGISFSYFATAASLRVKRSTNGGATWTAATTIATNGNGSLPDVAAAGSSAVVGYAVPTWPARLRRDPPPGPPAKQPGRPS